MSTVNRIGLLKNGIFIDFLSNTSISRYFISYKTISQVSYKEKENKVSITYTKVHDTYPYVVDIPGDTMVTIRKDGDSHFCEREKEDRILNLYNQLTMEYMTNYYDKD